jgi:hypothetical protein
LFGVTHAGVLTWETSNPFVVSAGNYSYSVTLTPKPSTTFLGESSNVNPGQAHGATVYATVSQLTSPSNQLVASAPEPATLVSLAIGGVCGAGFRLRRKVWSHRRPTATSGIRTRPSNGGAGKCAPRVRFDSYIISLQRTSAGGVRDRPGGVGSLLVTEPTVMTDPLTVAALARAS